MDTKLKDHLTQGKVLIADGATGTIMMAAGLPAGAAPELWNVERPEQVLALYRAYLEAGSQIILTNTFGGSRLKLAKTGLAARTHELNLAAARLARQAAGGRAYVAGDIGPTGELMAPLGSLTDDLALDVFSEQAAALVEGGVDAIWIESMSDLGEARAAVLAARKIADMPVFCSLSFGRKARTMMGVTPKQAVLELWPLGLTAIGANCGEGLDIIPEVLVQMRQALPEAVLIAKPNAGLPKLVDGNAVYDMEPAQFASRMVEFIDLGAQIVGSCCGSSPAFISALAKQAK